VGLPRRQHGRNRYLVIDLSSGNAADLDGPPNFDELIAYGPLLSDDGISWLGTAALVRASDAGEARSILASSRYAAIEIHNWQFGGRS
jgi:uncharacterized protein